MNKTVLAFIVIIALALGVFGFFISRQQTSKTSTKQDAQVPFNESYKVSDNKDLVAKSLSEVDQLIEIPDKKNAKVAEIVNLKSLQKKSKIFSKAYEHDIVIFLPTKTIIFDPLTKTIRDISKESYYDQVSK